MNLQPLGYEPSKLTICSTLLYVTTTREFKVSYTIYNLLRNLIDLLVTPARSPYYSPIQMVLGRGLEPLKSDYKSEILPIKLTQQVWAFLIKVTKSVNAHYSCAVLGMVVVVVALLFISVITALQLGCPATALHRPLCTSII